MHFFRYSFDDYMAVTPSGLSYKVDSGKLRETVGEAFSGCYNACACDSNDALLLQFFAKKSGAGQVPFFINEVDKFEMAGWVNNFIRNYYKEDFLKEFIESPLNHWMHIIKGRKEFYTSLGIDENNLFYLPMSEAAIEFTLPGFFNKRRFAANGTQGRFKDKIIAAGTHNRDFNTLTQAAAAADIEVHIITNLKLNPPIDAPGVIWHDSLPENDFIQAIKDAKCMVIPLHIDNRASGQMGCAIAMRMGKAVVTTRCESLSDHIIHGETGFLYESGSVEELSSLLARIGESPDELRIIGDNAQKKEISLSAIASKNISGFLDRIKHI